MPRQARSVQRTLGIAEWYGLCFEHLPAGRRREFAKLQLLPAKQRPRQDCLPRCVADKRPPCTKNSGVCSMRLVEREGDDAAVGIVAGPEGQPITVCPYRFYEDGRVFQWIGETILGTPSPLVVGQVGFLERRKESRGPRDVGRIDHVLVHPRLDAFSWCALEMQAVYFSGPRMSVEFEAMAAAEGDGMPFPLEHRRPDYRSSGPKRLMPQLQTEVPLLRRWGKKMGVLVDSAFFGALDEMATVTSVSNCDIAWFVVRYQEAGAELRLVPDRVVLTTLERAVEGLTGGREVDLPTFERRIREKLGRAVAR
jgi:hypothetical protein